MRLNNRTFETYTTYVNLYDEVTMIIICVVNSLASAFLY